MMFTFLERKLYKDPRFAHLSGAPKGWYWRWLVLLNEVTSELAAELEHLSAEAAAANPWVTYWDLRREMEGFQLIKERKYKDMARMLIAVRNGIKRGNPNAQFRVGDTSHLDNLQMTAIWIDLLKKYGNGMKSDLFSSNHYRKRPESPDFDKELQDFFNLADSSGYKDARLHLLEGMYWHGRQNYATNFAHEWGNMRDEFRCGFPSYDMSFYERAYANFCAREWLIGLKYYPRLERVNTWGHRFLDADLISSPEDKVPNTIISVLGDARYRSDFRFSPAVRCYLYEDSQKRPIAALWTELEDVDYGKRNAPVFNFNFHDLKLKFIDLMGNEGATARPENGWTPLPLSASPLFITAEPGSMKALVDSLKTGFSKETLGVSALKTVPRLINSTHLELELTNRVSHDIDAKIAIGFGKKIQRESILMKSGEMKKVIVALPEKFSADKITKMNLPIEITHGSNKETILLPAEAFVVRKAEKPLTVDCTEEAWKAYPKIPLANKTLSPEFRRSALKNNKEGYPGDFDVSFQIAWDTSAIYLRVTVKDDVFTGRSKKAKADWQRDCLQFYMDTFCNADHTRSHSGYNDDDLAFDFYPDEDGSVKIFRQLMPEVQLQGGVVSAKHAGTWVEPEMMSAKWIRTSDGYAYNIIINAQNLPPFVIRRGAIAGVCLFAVDNDGELFRKTMRTLTPPETEGYRNPHLYPAMILE